MSSIGLRYVATFDNLSVSTATDLIHITVATDKPVTLLEVKFSQVGIADVGEAQEELLAIGLYTGVTGGSGGTALTETALDPDNSTTPGAALLANNTTISTGGTLRDMEFWNVRVPTFWCPVPELRISVGAASDPIVWRLIRAPNDAITMSGVVKWTEG